MSGRIPIGKAILMTGMVTGVGYGIMALTTPTEQQFYDSLSPDLKKKVDDARAQKKVIDERQATLNALKAKSEEEKPVWSSSLQKK